MIKTNLKCDLVHRIINMLFFYFHNNVLRKRVACILMCISKVSYKKFGLFRNQHYDLQSYKTGIVILDYLQHNTVTISKDSFCKPCQGTLHTIISMLNNDCHSEPSLGCKPTCKAFILPSRLPRPLP
jgi:hypothetical protein